MSALAPTLGQVAVLLVALVLTVPPLGRHLAHLYTSERHLAVERGAYRVLRVDPDEPLGRCQVSLGVRASRRKCLTRPPVVRAR